MATIMILLIYPTLSNAIINAPPPSAFLRLSTEIQAEVMAQQSCKLCYQKELFEKNQISQFTLKIVKT